MLLAVMVHPADIQDRDGAKLVIEVERKVSSSPTDLGRRGIRWTVGRLGPGLCGLHP